MPLTVRKFLSLSLALVIITTSGLQSARAVFQSSASLDHAGHDMVDSHRMPSASHTDHDHAEVLPVNPAECLVVCLEALPDQYLVGQEIRVASFDDAVSYPYPAKRAPLWLSSNQLQSLHLAARGPPFDAWAENLNGAQAVLLRTHRLRI